MEKKLYLSSGNKILAGVCGGIAEYFNVDATLIRIIWVIASLLFNVIMLPVIAYVLCWAIIPSDDRY